jgi:hypothetical protein
MFPTSTVAPRCLMPSPERHHAFLLNVSMRMLLTLRRLRRKQQREAVPFLKAYDLTLLSFGDKHNQVPTYPHPAPFPSPTLQHALYSLLFFSDTNDEQSTPTHSLFPFPTPACAATSSLVHGVQSRAAETVC